jgi:hypothetical protein
MTDRKPISTVDLKALYDFSMIHAERMTNVGKGSEASVAETQRLVLYNELLKRLSNEALKLDLKK